MLSLSSKPSKPPKPQASPQRGRFTLPLPPPYRFGSIGCRLVLDYPWLSWPPKKCRKNVFILLMAPFGSDQSRHVDHFGAKKCNVDDFVAKKSSCWRLLVKKSECWCFVLPHNFIKPLKYVGNLSVLWKRPWNTQSDYTIMSKWIQSDPKSLECAKNDPKITRLAQSQVAPRLLVALLTPQKRP